MPLPGAAVAPGDLIDGRYLVEDLLGSGGMAVVHRARHTGTGVAYALKLVHPHLVPRPELRDLFLREARVGGRIGKSPHVAEVLDAGFDAARGTPYLVMELLEGETLEECAAREGALPPALLGLVLEQLADALDQAHAAGVIHRDLKPSNLFLTRGRRGAPCLKVMDFGIAKVLEAGTSQTATQIGTPAYAAPEQMGPAVRLAAARQGISVAASVSPATDVWALGILAYELTTGLPAAQFWAAEASAEIAIKAVLFAHDAASARAGERAVLLPPGFDAWFARATDVDAARRWASAGEAVGALLDLLLGVDPAAAVPRAPGGGRGAYGPGATEITGTPAPVDGAGRPLVPLAGANPGAPGSPAPVAAPIAWAGGTPPPSVVAPPTPSTALPRPPAEPRRVTRWIVLGGAALSALLAAGAGALVLAPRHAAPDACRASGERCDEACQAGDAWSCGRLGARHERGEGVTRDEARAVALYEKACDAADALACSGLGRLHRLGRGGLSRDITRARGLFERACDAGRDAGAGPAGREAAHGCALLGELYRDGAGVSRDDVRAAALFRDGCAQGDPTACKDLGGMHQSGRGGLSRDDAAAAARYREACDGGEVLGCNDLGVLVGAGRGGLARDDRLASELYQRACDGGEMLGCDNLAWMIERGKGGFAADPQRAVALYQKACDRGDARGCGNLAVMYEEGRGLPADLPRAAALYQEACRAGDAHACNNLGAMTERGLGGLSRDDGRAASLYRSACDAADMDACHDLARFLEAGRGGLTRDDARALSLYERACDGGATRACVSAGELLAEGRGAARDERRAVSLWQRACDAGLPSGCADLGWAYFLGQGVLRDRPQGLELLRRGCDGGSAWGCQRLGEAEGRKRRKL